MHESRNSLIKIISIPRLIAKNQPPRPGQGPVRNQAPPIDSLAKAAKFRQNPTVYRNFSTFRTRATK